MRDPRAQFPIEAKLKASEATVLTASGGQGVLVPGPFILTATHCIKWNGEGAMALGVHFIETVTTRNGRQLRVEARFADAISDIAVLGPLDDQEFSDDDAFVRWCDTTSPVPVTGKIPQRHCGTQAVHVLTHEGRWVAGEIVRYNPGVSGVMYVATDEPIKCGTSGGPVVDSSGQLVGVVSQFLDPKPGEKCQGRLPIACFALPAWVWLRIRKAQEMKDR